MTKRVLYTLICPLLLWVAGLIAFGYSINHFSADYSTQTDAIIALTGGRNRISEAVNLLNHHLADKLFISGVGKGISWSQIKRTQRLKLKEVPDSHIHIGRHAADTVGNAIETGDWISAHHITSIRLVTSNYHLIRAQVEFKRLMPELEIILHPVYSDHIEKKWWTSWQTFSLICKEYNKLTLSLVKYILHL
ncbi:MAG: YdcF family protein [Alphaproteobacteria bacterium]|nr:YdcF family protein [Alphaproteobacteria bacterium]